MPKYNVTQNFNGEEIEYEIDAEDMMRAEWRASDALREKIYSNTSYTVNIVEGEVEP